jgi:NAD-dependent deacetylase
MYISWHNPASSGEYAGMMQMRSEISKVAEALRTAQRLFFITGAGISAESGIPTFRGKDGYWRQYNPMELASREGFARDPALVWEWYNERKATIRRADPNPGHLAIAELESAICDTLLATQNVDGLHQRAGSKQVVEIHGSIWETRCTREGTLFARDAIDTEAEVPPRCACGALLRPNVVWFGEALPVEPISRITDFILTGRIDLAFVIGTSALFAYISGWAWEAKEQGARVVEVNLDPSPISTFADFVFRDKAGVVLPQIYKAMQS